MTMLSLKKMLLNAISLINQKLLRKIGEPLSDLQTTVNMARTDYAIADSDEQERATTLNRLANAPIESVVDVEAFFAWYFNEQWLIIKPAAGTHKVLNSRGGKRPAFSQKETFGILRVDTLIEQPVCARIALPPTPEKPVRPDCRHNAGSTTRMDCVEQFPRRGWGEKRTGALHNGQILRRENLRSRDVSRDLIERYRIAGQLRRPA